MRQSLFYEQDINTATVWKICDSRVIDATFTLPYINKRE